MVGAEVVKGKGVVAVGVKGWVVIDGLIDGVALCEVELQAPATVSGMSKIRKAAMNKILFDRCQVSILIIVRCDMLPPKEMLYILFMLLRYLESKMKDGQLFSRMVFRAG